MSFFRLPKLLRTKVSKESSRGRRGSARSSGKRSRRREAFEPRRLQFDALESRELLSVSPATPADLLATHGINTSLTMGAAHSVASDNNGDFVVTYARDDGPVPVDGAPGKTRSDWNVYAQYYTNDVQRIYLPDAILNANPNPTPGAQAGKFSLDWGGNEVQKLSVTATYQPYVYSQQDIQGTITLAADPWNNGTIQTTTIDFNESNYDAADPAQRPQAIIQNQLRGLGGWLSDCTVEAPDPHTFLIEAGNASQGKVEPLIQVMSEGFTSGFLPAATVSMVRQPATMADIHVSPTDPTATAAQIENAFAAAVENIPYAPIVVQPTPYTDVVQSQPAPYTTPLVGPFDVAQVTAVPVDLPGYTYGTVFDLTFTGAAARQQVPQMKITAATDYQGSDLTGDLASKPGDGVVTVKESSGEFRVNPLEPIDPLTGVREYTDQSSPSVAMDATGDFVITWASEVPNSVLPGSVSDVYARRFSPMGVVADPSQVRGAVQDANGSYVQGVRSWVNDIQDITFNTTAPSPLTGTFQLQIPYWVTKDEANPPMFTSAPIPFDSRDLASVASAIQTALITAGYDGAHVSLLNGVNPYKFEVTFGGQQAGLGQPAITITPTGLPNTTTNVQDVSSSTFRVNTTTTNAQDEPAVGMDEVGDFVIAWSNHAQALSYFNTVSFQRFDRYGVPQGSETPATQVVNGVHVEPAVAMSPDGHFGIAWVTILDPNYFIGSVVTTHPYFSLYDPSGSVLLGQQPGPGAADLSLAYDSANNVVISGDEAAADNIGAPGEDVFAIEYGDNPATATAPETYTVVRPLFRVNGAIVNGGAGGNAAWPLDQRGGQVAMDADGDLTATYAGYGPDMSQELYIPGSYFQNLINSTTNSDLLAYFNPQTDSLGSGFYNFNLGFLGGVTGDIDAAIENVLLNAMHNGATNEQVGRLRAILDSVAGMLRGEANGVMYSQWNSDPKILQQQGDPLTALNSDSVANNQRDGHNTRILLSFNDSVTTGGFTLDLVRWDVPGFEAIAITPVYTNNVLDEEKTREAIESALNAAVRVGKNWPGTSGAAGYSYYLPPVTVDTFSTPYYQNACTIRNGTPWDLRSYLDPTTDVVYEITFEGEGHDDIFYTYPVKSDLKIGSGPVLWPNTTIETYGDQGTSHYYYTTPPASLTTATGEMILSGPSMAIQPNGSFVVAWPQQDQYTDGTVANTNVYYREFTESANTAGPLLTDMLRADGTPLGNNGTILVPATGATDGNKVIFVFDQDMMTSGPDSVTNPNNYHLYDSNGEEIIGGVASVKYGVNMGYDLGLESLPTNKFEAVLTLDGNGNAAGTPSLPLGTYTLQINTGALENTAGNVMGSTGYNPAGNGFTRTFHVQQTYVNPTPPVVPWDVPVNAPDPTRWDPTQGYLGTSGTTYAESRHAVAVDAAGAYVVVWTAMDAQNRDAVYFRMFNKDGAPTSPVTAVDPMGTGTQYAADSQKYATVACDSAGDFVVTWTSYHNGNAEVYARRYDALGNPEPNAQGDASAFEVNTFANGKQKWSSVAMDAQGDFIVAWSSYGQENPTTGTGYGVYARRYDFTGTPEVWYDSGASWMPEHNPSGDPTDNEFQVNVTTAGSQRFPSVAMDAQGDFVVTWTSGNGTGDNVMYRAFLADGTPAPDPITNRNGSLYGEEIANQAQGTEHHYSDVAISPDGGQFVITWTSNGQDGNGDGVYARVFPFPRAALPRRVYGVDLVHPVYTDDPRTTTNPTPLPASGGQIEDADAQTSAAATTKFFIDLRDVPANLAIADLDVSLSIRHPRDSDLAIVLKDPLGNQIRLVAGHPVDAKGNPTTGANFTGTILDDEAPSGTSIDNGTPPYTGSFVPEQPLTTLIGEPIQGVWELDVTDQNPGPFEPNGIFIPPYTSISTPIPAYLDEWNLDFQPKLIPGPEVQVNTSTLGNQDYSSVAVDHSGNFVVTWGGRGTQPGQMDASGVYYQRYTAASTPIGSETRVNQQTDGNHTYSSVGSDADGNFVVAWTGPGPVASNPANTEVFTYNSRAESAQPDTSVPWVSQVLYNGSQEPAGSVLQGPISQLTVVFDKFMDVRSGAAGVASVLNPNNYRLTLDGADVSSSIVNVQFPYDQDPNTGAIYPDPATGKYEATITFNPPLDAGNSAQGDYSLTVKDSIYDAPSPGIDGPLALNGEYTNTSGTDPSVTGDNGYVFPFSVAPSQAQNQTGAEILVSQNTNVVDQFSPHFGMGLAEERSAHSMAVDHSGDFVTVWTSYGAVDSRELSFYPNPNQTGALTGSFQLQIGNTTSAPIAMNSQNLGSVATAIQNALIAGGYSGAQARAVPNTPPYQFEISLGDIAAANRPTITILPNATLAAEVSVSVAQETTGDVYARLYDRNNNPLTNAFRVNQYTLGDQRNASVACDSTGDFVVVWESQGEESNGSWGVYARLYDSTGHAKTPEIHVNTTIANDQVHPAVAMDDAGHFVVVWATGGQSYSYFNNIRGQLFDRDGTPLFNEFLVTQANLPGVNQPGTAANNPAVAMDPLGTYFVVAWDQITQQLNGVALDSVVYARLFNRLDPNGNVLDPNANTNAAFQVNSTGPNAQTGSVANPVTTHRTARNPQIAITPADLSGNATRADSFIVTWESYNETDNASANGPTSYGIYYKHLTLTGTVGSQNATPQGADTQANMTYQLPVNNTISSVAYLNSVLSGDHVNPSVAMDANGDYAITWNGPGAQVSPIDPQDQPIVDADPNGVWIRNFHATGNDASDAVTVETRVNRTAVGVQEFPTVGMTPDGQEVVVWNGQGVGDPHGIFFRRYPQTADTAGPQVADVVVGGQSLGVSQIQPGTPITSPTTTVPPIILYNANDTTNEVNAAGSTIVVVFDEAMYESAGDPNSVDNPANYVVTKDGTNIAPQSITYGLDRATNKFEAVLQFGSPLTSGTYIVTVLGTVWDKAGNPLGQSGIYQNGYASESTQFDVAGVGPGTPTTPDIPANATPLYPRDHDGLPTVAKDAAGDSVVVWVAYGQTLPQTALEPANAQQDTKTEGNIMAQWYDPKGRPVGSAILVNSDYTNGNQTHPAVAMDDNGDFVVAWSGEGQFNGAVNTHGIYFRRFRRVINSVTPIDNAEQSVSTYAPKRQGGGFAPYVQDDPAVAMDSKGDFVVTWDGEGQGSFNGKAAYDAHGVWARRYNYLGAPLDKTSQILVNTYRANAQEAPDVAMDAGGNQYFVVWRSQGEGPGAWSVYGQRFKFPTGARIGRETRINTTLCGAPIAPKVAMDQYDNTVVVWSSARINGYDAGFTYHVFQRRFRGNGAPIDARDVIVDSPASAGYLKLEPSVAMARNGTCYAVTWTSMGQDGANLNPPTNTDGVYGHLFWNYAPTNAKSKWQQYTSYGTPVGDFLINKSLTGNQNQSAVAMDATGDFTTVWVGPETFTTTDSKGNTTTSTSIGIWMRNAGVPAPATTPISNPAIAGTAGNDQFVVNVNSGPGGWTVLVNGQAQAIPAGSSGVVLDGGGGSDTLTLQGSGGNETFQVYPDHVVITDANTGFSLSTKNIQVANLTGSGGKDQATFNASTAGSAFTYHADTGVASMLSGANTYTVANVSNVTALAGGKSNTADLYDSPGDDVFTAAPGKASLAPASGGAYAVNLTGFRTVRAHAGAGGNDVANLYSGTGADTLAATFDGATAAGRLFGRDGSGPFSLSFDGFERVVAHANRAGKHVARLTDTALADLLQLHGTEARLTDLKAALGLWADNFDNVTTNLSSKKDKVQILPPVKFSYRIHRPK